MGLGEIYGEDVREFEVRKRQERRVIMKNLSEDIDYIDYCDIRRILV